MTDTIKMDRDETLEHFLLVNQDGIDYVVLSYIHKDVHYVAEYSNLKGEDGQELFQCFKADVLDAEYSIIGGLDEALIFAGEYSVWDGTDVYLKDRIVFGTIESEPWEFGPNGAYDLLGMGYDAANVKYLGLTHFVNRRLTYYHGQAFPKGEVD